MSRACLVAMLALALLAAAYAAGGQTPGHVYRVGIIHEGGPYQEEVDGLRQGLRERGLEEGQHFVLDIRDTKGDLKAVGEAARDLERRNVDLICTVATSVTLVAKRATVHTPIVFVAGTDPVAAGLVESYAKPGGRLTGLYSQGDLTAKRLEILKEIIPTLRRVVAFYSPDNPSAQRAVKIARDAVRQLKIELLERRVASVEELRASLRALRPGEADALFYLGDAMVSSQSELIIDTARAKRLPTMFNETSLVARGALASYGLSYREIGRMLAKHVQRILAGTLPKDLPVETYDKVELALNLRTAREIGLTIPPSVRFRADKVIE